MFIRRGRTYEEKSASSQLLWHKLKEKPHCVFVSGILSVSLPVGLSLCGVLCACIYQATEGVMVD